MKKLYLHYEFDAHVHKIACRCAGTKGYHVINNDGSHDLYEYAEALHRIMLVLKSKEDALITAGDDAMMETGFGRSYGRLIRHWCCGKLSVVIWDEHGNIISTLDKAEAVSDRSFARMYLDLMLTAHAEACAPKMEATEA